MRVVVDAALDGQRGDSADGPLRRTSRVYAQGLWLGCLLRA